MYKIYINGTPLWLSENPMPIPIGYEETDCVRLPYRGKVKAFLQMVDMLEKVDRLQFANLYFEDINVLWKDFVSQFKWVEAAGGVVQHSDLGVLMIYRKDSWDLPKGKIDKGESVEAAALREVEEETGIGQLVLGDHLVDTYHTYRINKKRYLKKTYWFAMTTQQTTLVPQTEEDIELAVFQTDIHHFIHTETNIYPNIQEVLKKYWSTAGH